MSIPADFYSPIDMICRRRGTVALVSKEIRVFRDPQAEAEETFLISILTRFFDTCPAPRALKDPLRDRIFS